MTLQMNYHISRDNGARLYALEERVAEALKKTAKERMKFMAEGTEFWGADGGIAQALFDLLDNFDPDAALSAAKAYIEKVEEVT